MSAAELPGSALTPTTPVDGVRRRDPVVVTAQSGGPEEVTSRVRRRTVEVEAVEADGVEADGVEAYGVGPSASPTAVRGC